MPSLQQTDPQVSELIWQEAQRQASTLELIASENHVSAAVLEAAGSVMTNKYAEGYPARVTTAGASTTTRSRPLRSSGRSRCSAAGSPTCSPTAAPTPTWPRSWR